MIKLTKIWLACDPGAAGSLCCLFENGEAEFVDFKKENLKGYIERFKAIQSAYNVIDIRMIAIEKVASMTGQGVKSVFSFGQRLGELEGMLQTLNLGYIFIRPQEWQKTCGVTPKSGKKGIYETISKIYPQAELKGPKGGLLDGRSDALGMAHHLRIKFP